MFILLSCLQQNCDVLTTHPGMWGAYSRLLGPAEMKIFMDSKGDKLGQIFHSVY